MQVCVLDVIVKFKSVQPLQGEIEFPRIELHVGLLSDHFCLLDDDGVGQRNTPSMRGVVVNDPC